MKKQTLALLLLLISYQVLAQKDPMKWKKVPVEDLKMTSYEYNPTASAVVLCDYGKYYFDINPNGKNIFFFQKRHVRIKILKKEGLKYAKVRIPFMNMNYEKFPEEIAISIKGMTYNLDSKNQLEYTRLKLRKIEYKDSTKSIRIAEFELPDVRVGSVIEYQYTKASLDFVRLPDWLFQSDIPVVHSELRLYIPRYFKYLCLPVNFENFDIIKEDYFSRTLFLRNPYRNRYNQGINYDMGGKTIRFVKKHNLPIEDENFVINKRKNIEKLKIHLLEVVNENSDYIWQKYTHSLFTTTVEGYEDYEPIQRKNIIYPAGFILYRMHDWERVNKDLIVSERLGLPMVKPWKYKAKLDSIVKGKTGKFDQMLAVYDYVRKNIKWNGLNSIYVNPVFNKDLAKLYSRITKKQIKEKSLQKPFDAQIGSSSEVNLILISLLKKLKIEANAVLLNRRDKERFIFKIPDPNQFNNVIAQVKINGKEFLLDATDSVRTYKLLNRNQLVNNAFVINAKGFEWISTKNLEPTKTIINDSLYINDDLECKRKLSISMSGYEAMDMRKRLNAKNNINNLPDILNLENAKIKSIQNINDNDKRLIIKLEDIESRGGENVAVKLKFKPKHSFDDFWQNIRKNNVEFEYPYEQIYNLHIKIPEKYSYQTLKNKKFNAYNDNAYFIYKTQQNKDGININLRIGIKTNEFPGSQYDNLRQLFSLVEKQLKKEIIIKRS